MWIVVFPILDLGNNSFIHLFLMIPFNLDHNCAMHNIIYNTQRLFLLVSSRGSYPTTPQHIWHTSIMWCSIPVSI